MNKRIVQIFGGMLVLLVSGLLVLTFYLDGMVKSGIEENGSKLLKTSVTVDNVDLSIFDGSGRIEGFKVANPDDFSNRNAIDIQEVSIEVNLRSLLSDQVEVKEIRVQNPQIYFEQKGFGVNLRTLNENMEASSEESSDTKLIVEYLLIQEGEIEVRTDIDKERAATASISSFELTGIGKEGSNTVQQSFKEILEPLLEAAIEEAIKGGVTEQIENRVRNLFNDQ